MNLLAFCLFACCLGYSAVVLIIRHALGRVRRGNAEGAPFVSVIIAARNEALRLGACLDSLRTQDYPPDQFEVIVADDRSTDRTSGLLDDYRQGWPALRAVHIDRVPEGISPKKNALAAAIAQARGDIILQTDADCIIPAGWIRGMAGRFEPGVGFVAGVAPYRKAPGALNSFIRHEYLWNAALSAASIALGRGTHASGRNMGFRRDIFDRLHGYGESAAVLSGDDTLLLQRIERSKLAQAVTMPDPDTHVFTDAPDSLSAFFRQRTRHFSTGKYFAPAQIVTGGVVYCFHGLLLGTLAAALFIPDLRFPAAAAFAWKSVTDALIAGRVRVVLGLEVDWRRFILNEFLLLAYMTIFPLAGLCVPVSWKRAGEKAEEAAAPH